MKDPSSANHDGVCWASAVGGARHLIPLVGWDAAHELAAQRSRPVRKLANVPARKGSSEAGGSVNRPMPTSVVYRITYPNGKIYIGQDRTNSINYFGSADGRLIEVDFTADQRRSFTITRDILWSSDTATRSEVSIMENKFIRAHRANEQAIGYNRTPRFRG